VRQVVREVNAKDMERYERIEREVAEQIREQRAKQSQ
jgi:hypothetical protein